MNTDVIPEGLYCHGLRGMRGYVCPYWSLDRFQPEQGNGYCAFLKKGDWDEDCSGLIWDQVKECGINDGLDENK